MIIADVIGIFCLLAELVGNIKKTVNLDKGTFPRQAKTEQMGVSVMMKKSEMTVVRSLIFLGSIYGGYAVISLICKVL